MKKVIYFLLLLLGFIYMPNYAQAQSCCATANIQIVLDNVNLNVGNDNGATSEYTWLITAQDAFGNFGDNNACYTVNGLPDNTNQTVNFGTTIFNQTYNQTPSCCFGDNSDLPNTLTFEIEGFEDSVNICSSR